MKSQQYLHFSLYFALMLGSLGGLRASDPGYDSGEPKKRIVRLDGAWKFAVGDGAERSEPTYDDSSWSTIHAPDTWQDEGYRDYNGYAWYRKTFDFPSGYEKRGVFLSLGKIDDVDEVFVNGHRIAGMGRFPPNYESAYDSERVYALPVNFLQPGKGNVIAVRVFDGGGVGGIVSGRLGLYTGLTPALEVTLDGSWEFSAGDNPQWKQPEYSGADFKQITVPLAWQNGGYPNLHGYAWYRKTFTFNRKSADQTMVMLLGKIDDYDEVFLNGVSIGRTGEIDHPGPGEDGHSYALNRAYYFPASLLKENNTIAVRVYDAGGYGGIYAGPIGIISQTDFVKYWESRRHHPVRDALRWFWTE